MQNPSYKDKGKGKAILEPIEENKNRAKRVRINSIEDLFAEVPNSQGQNANMAFKNNLIEAPLGIPYSPPSFCGPFGTGSSRTNSKSFEGQIVNFPTLCGPFGTGSSRTSSKSFEGQIVNFPTICGPFGTGSSRTSSKSFEGQIVNFPTFCAPFGSGSSLTSSKSFEGQIVNYPTFDLNEDPIIMSNEPIIDLDLNVILSPTSLITTNTKTGTEILCIGNGEQRETEMIKNKMEKIAMVNGVQKVTKESVEVLNKGLDIFLKRIIGAVIEVKERVKRGGENTIRIEDIYLAVQENPHLLGEKTKEKLEKIMNRCFLKE